MSDQEKNIWYDDLLNRRAEASMLERFLLDQTRALKFRGRDQSYVLGLDAPYGEGKTWFLDRFTRELRLEFPVAHIDAWVDDTNDQPLVALMAAIEEALEPFFSTQTIRDTFDRAKSSLFPLIAKGALAAGTHIARKYLGEQILDDVIALGEPATDAGTLVKIADQSLESTERAVSGIIDRQAAAMLSAYHKRRSSILYFKDQIKNVLRQLNADGQNRPVFIVIDELDRCRPTYAIEMLEEIKHLFDISGLVFIIGLHSEQLKASVSNVYGSEFRSRDYLSRFFTRSYTLRTPNMLSLCKYWCLRLGISNLEFNYPPFIHDGKADTHAIHILMAYLFTFYRVSARDIYRYLDAVVVFKSVWTRKADIEAVYLIAHIVSFLSHTPALTRTDQETGGPLTFKFTNSMNVREDDFVKINELLNSYETQKSKPLQAIANRTHISSKSDLYVENVMTVEFAKDYGSEGNRAGPMSVLQDYADLVREIGRFQAPSLFDSDHH